MGVVGDNGKLDENRLNPIGWRVSFIVGAKSVLQLEIDGTNTVFAHILGPT